MSKLEENNLQDNSRSGIVHLDKEVLTTFKNEYDKVASQAIMDKSYKSDFAAAYLAPVKFITKSYSFESTFDNILYHLTEAYKKTQSEDEKYYISRALEEIFQKIAVALQEKKITALREAKKSFLKKLFKSLNNSHDNFFKNLEDINKTIRPNNIKNIGYVDLFKTTPQGMALFSVGPEVANIIEATITYMFEYWEIKQDASFFNIQLINIYSKLLNSECFNNLGLVSNSFLRVKQELLPVVYKTYNYSKCIELSAYDIHESNKKDTFNIISNLLITDKKYDYPYQVLDEEKNNLSFLLGSDLYQKNKKNVIEFTYIEKGLEETLKLSKYEINENGIKNTLNIISEVLKADKKYDFPYQVLVDLEKSNLLFQLSANFYHKCKKNVIKSTYKNKGLEETLKLLVYDLSTTQKDDSLITLLNGIISYGKLSDFKILISIIEKENNNLLFNNLDQLIKTYKLKLSKSIELGMSNDEINQLKEFIEYIKTLKTESVKEVISFFVTTYKNNVDLNYINSKWNDKIFKREKVKNHVSLFTALLHSNEKYNEVERKIKKGKKIRVVILSLISITLVASLTILFYGNYKTNYNDYIDNSKTEIPRIKSATLLINNYISDSQYRNAYNTIKNEIIYNTDTPLLASKEIDNTNKVQLSLFKKLLDKILVDISKLKLVSIDNEYYTNLNNNALQVYESTLNNLSEDLRVIYDNKSITSFKKIDKLRNNYLIVTEKEIKNLISQNKKEEALYLINSIYHNSNSEYVDGVLGFGSKTYKEYWEEVKESLLESLEY